MKQGPGYITECCNDSVVKKKFPLCNHLLYSFKIFIDVLAFLCVKANSNKICDKISFPFYSKKKADVSIFVKFPAYIIN